MPTIKAITYDGIVQGGKFIPDDANLYALRYLFLEGKRVREVVDMVRKKRSDAQNRYWFGVVVKAFMEAMDEDFDAQRVHYAIVSEIHFEVVQGLDGRILKSPKPTHNLSTTEFMELIAKAQRLASEFYNIYIPDPNEAGYDIQQEAA